MNLDETLSVEVVTEKVSDTRLNLEDSLVGDGLMKWELISSREGSNGKKKETHSEIENTVIETSIESDVDTIFRVDRSESIVHVERKLVRSFRDNVNLGKESKM